MPVAADSGGPLWAPWHVLHSWSPFNIDALGLVTLLGAEEINAAVGRLVSSAYLEYLPLLGAYVIAGDRFTEKAAGWNLYNISQGIHTTDLAAWLTRWMLSQNFETTRNFVRWKITPPRSRQKDTIISILISFVLNGFLIAGTVLAADWYGLANALAMDVSILVRVYVVGQQRLAVDAMIDKAVEKFGPPPKGTYEAARYGYKEWKHKTKGRKEGGVRLKRSAPPAPAMDGHSIHSDSSSPSNGQKHATQHVRSTPPQKPKAEDYPNAEWNGASGKPIKVLIIQSDSKAVTFEMPNELVIPPSLFIEGPLILNPKTYFVVRSIGWLAFAIHIITIGMAILSTQLYTIVLIVLPTLLIVKKTGCDDSDWTPWMQTFGSWKTSLLHGESQANKRNQPENGTPATKANEFRFLRHCYIGSRLKAEVYEWPESYELREQGNGSDTKWVGGVSPPDAERSKKRQDLYAWLALTNDEEESMDKWDLFPHIRNDNFSWWETYKHKKHALIGKRVPMGPQHVDDLEKKKFAAQTQTSQSSQDQGVGIKQFGKSGRTRTSNFVRPHGGGQAQGPTATTKPEHRQGSSGHAGGSSAFPAISAHESNNIIHPPPPSDSASASEGDEEVSGLPHVDTGGSSIDPSAEITQSPTVLNATDEQP